MKQATRLSWCTRSHNDQALLCAASDVERVSKIQRKQHDLQANDHLRRALTRCSLLTTVRHGFYSKCGNNNKNTNKIVVRSLSLSLVVSQHGLFCCFSSSLPRFIWQLSYFFVPVAIASRPFVMRFSVWLLHSPSADASMTAKKRGDLTSRSEQLACNDTSLSSSTHCSRDSTPRATCVARSTASSAALHTFRFPQRHSASLT